jgi:hypothetical protein
MEEEHPVTHLQATRTIKVRYGRARLTVKRWGDVRGGEVGEAVSAFARGEMDAKRLAWTFVRDRVQAASPSFDWGTADLARLVKLVAAESAEPPLSAGDPEALAAELAAGAGTNRPRIGEAVATVRKRSPGALASVRGRLGRLSGHEEIMEALRGRLLDPVRRLRAIGDSILRRVTELSVDRVGAARERLWGILGDSYGRLRGRRTS